MIRGAELARAGMGELADPGDLKSPARKGVSVQLRLPAFTVERETRSVERESGQILLAKANRTCAVALHVPRYTFNGIRGRLAQLVRALP